MYIDLDHHLNSYCAFAPYIHIRIHCVPASMGDLHHGMSMLEVALAIEERKMPRLPAALGGQVAATCIKHGPRIAAALEGRQRRLFQKLCEHALTQHALTQVEDGSFHLPEPRPATTSQLSPLRAFNQASLAILLLFLTIVLAVATSICLGQERRIHYRDLAARRIQQQGRDILFWIEPYKLRFCAFCRTAFATVLVWREPYKQPLYHRDTADSAKILLERRGRRPQTTTVPEPTAATHLPESSNSSVVNTTSISERLDIPDTPPDKSPDPLDELSMKLANTQPFASS